MRIAHDGFGGVSGVVDDDFLCGDQDVDGVAIGFDIESSIRSELQQVQTGQVAGRVVQEHVFAARIAGVDAGRILRCVPAIDRGVVLHAGIAAVPGGLGNFSEEVFGFVGLHYSAVGDRLGGEVGFLHHRVHEVVGDADTVVGVLEEDGTVGVGVGR